MRNGATSAGHPWPIHRGVLARAQGVQLAAGHLSSVYLQLPLPTTPRTHGWHPGTLEDPGLPQRAFKLWTQHGGPEKRPFLLSSGMMSCSPARSCHLAGVPFATLTLALVQRLCVRKPNNLSLGVAGDPNERCPRPLPAREPTLLGAWRLRIPPLLQRPCLHGDRVCLAASIVGLHFPARSRAPQPVSGGTPTGEAGGGAAGEGEGGAR